MGNNLLRWQGPGWYASSGGLQFSETSRVGECQLEVLDTRSMGVGTPRWYDQKEEFFGVDDPKQFSFVDETRGE